MSNVPPLRENERFLVSIHIDKKTKVDTTRKKRRGKVAEQFPTPFFISFNILTIEVSHLLHLHIYTYRTVSRFNQACFLGAAPPNTWGTKRTIFRFWSEL
jgi:hypothetical protein